MRTLRFLLAAGLAAAVVAAAGCGSKGSSAPAVEPGKPAGEVRELAGVVTAHRGSDAPRTLKVGDEVSGDDVVATGADGSVVIELRHNGVRWSLGPGQEKQVSTSAAWQAPRGGGGTVDDRSTAAGRHAEREAAETAETTVATADEAPAPGGSAPAPAAAAAPSAIVATPTPTPTRAPPPPPPPPPERKAKAESARREEQAPRGGSASDSAAMGDAEDLAPPKIASAGASVSVSATDGPLDAASARRTMQAMAGALGACHDDSGTVKLKFTVNAAGKVTDLATMTPACVAEVVASMQFAATDADTVVTATVVIR